RADTRGRIDLLRKNADRDATLAREMAGDLASTATEIAESQAGLAFEIWFALERVGQLPESLQDLAGRLVGPGVDARALLAGIDERMLRERALNMMRERRPDWP